MLKEPKKKFEIEKVSDNGHSRQRISTVHRNEIMFKSEVQTALVFDISITFQ